MEKSTFFRQTNVFTTKVTKELISRKFLSVIAFYTFPLLCGLFLSGSNSVKLTSRKI